MVDKVHPLKLEYPDEGGGDLNLNPTGLNPNQDHIDIRGVVIQSDTSKDEIVAISRDVDNNMNFKDNHNSIITLTELRDSSGFDTDTILTTISGDLVVTTSGNIIKR